MSETYIVQWKWSTSKGRDSYGYTICSCFIDGKRLGTCNGGGYDLKGTAFANALMKQFPNELLAIAEKAYTQYTVREVKQGRKTVKEYDKIETAPGLFYGMSAYFDTDGNPVRIYLDGATGLSSIQRIAEYIGYKLEFVTQDLAKLTRI